MSKRQPKQPSAPVSKTAAAHWVNVEAAQAYAKETATAFNASCAKVATGHKAAMLAVLRECYAAGARILATEWVEAFLGALEGQAAMHFNVARANMRRIASGLASGFEPEKGTVGDVLHSSGDLQAVSEQFPKVTAAGAPKGGKAEKAEKAAPAATAPSAAVTLELVSAWIRERATAADRVAIMNLVVSTSIANVKTAEGRLALEAARKTVEKIAA